MSEATPDVSNCYCQGIWIVNGKEAPRRVFFWRPLSIPAILPVFYSDEKAGILKFGQQHFLGTKSGSQLTPVLAPSWLWPRGGQRNALFDCQRCVPEFGLGSFLHKSKCRFLGAIFRILKERISNLAPKNRHLDRLSKESRFLLEIKKRASFH